MKITCIPFEKSGKVALSLRRFRYSDDGPPCKVGSYHNAEFPLGQVDAVIAEGGYLQSRDEEKPAKDDPRWPTKCACGYEFTPDDYYQVFQSYLYRNMETGELVSDRELPVGAIYFSWFENWRGSPEWQARTGGLGSQLIVETPAGTWNVDGPSSDGGGWTWSGTFPKITANPSIWIGKGTPREYHGWLRDGVLIPC